MRNRYPGTCYRCGLRVEAGDGHFERNGHQWRTQHADCAIRWRGKPAPTVAEARAARQPTCTPEPTMPPDLLDAPATARHRLSQPQRRGGR